MFTSAGGHCTFFVNGNNWACIYDYADNLKYVYGKGHQIASHTWSHADLQTLNQNQTDSEILKVDVALQNILGVTPACLRPPYGSYNDTVRAAAANHNKSLIIWDLDSGDSTGASPAESEKTYDDNKFSATLPLNHETCNTTVYDFHYFQIHPH
ncbi:hypothetical protein C8R47DRAFT_1197223 [Mycena vitilis]|nr:hypothetical protein C8R47DRAFT_1197223 [Mycena vitilis]